MRGYIAMLATEEEHRGKGIATALVAKSIDLMIEQDADEIALETEETNHARNEIVRTLRLSSKQKTTSILPEW